MPCRSHVSYARETLNNRHLAERVVNLGWPMTEAGNQNSTVRRDSSMSFTLQEVGSI